MKKCDICGKQPIRGFNVSHSHNRSKRRLQPNLQNVRALIDGRPQQVSVCASCIRSGKVVKAVRGQQAQAVAAMADAS